MHWINPGSNPVPSTRLIRAAFWATSGLILILDLLCFCLLRFASFRICTESSTGFSTGSSTGSRSVPWKPMKNSPPFLKSLPLRPCPDDRAENSMQGSLNESAGFSRTLFFENTFQVLSISTSPLQSPKLSLPNALDLFG